MKTATVIARMATGNYNAFLIADDKLASTVVCQLNKDRLTAALAIYPRPPAPAPKPKPASKPKRTPATAATPKPKPARKERPATDANIGKGIDTLAAALAKAKHAEIAAGLGIKPTTFARSAAHKVARDTLLADTVDAIEEALLAL